MCIRDSQERSACGGLIGLKRVARDIKPTPATPLEPLPRARLRLGAPRAVSYTHLTLPTICSV
eukprot:3045074-Alexandrium_andersonii.AAC.1